MEQIFPKNLDELDYSNKDACIKKLEDYIRYMKERCEFMMQGLTPTGVMNRVKMNGIDAGIISTGILESKDGETFVLDLDNSTLTADFDSLKIGTKNAATEEYTDQAEADAKSYANSQDTASWNSKTQDDVFKKLTNNYEDQGIYIHNGKIYINGEYIQGQTISGNTLSGNTINNGNGTFAVDTSGNVTANSLTSNNATITGGSINMKGTDDWSFIKLFKNSGSSYDQNYYSYLMPIGVEVRNSDNGFNTTYYGGGVVCKNYSTDKNRYTLYPTGVCFYDSNGSALTGLYSDTGLDCHQTYSDWVSVDHASNNNVWVNGASITIPRTGFYIVTAQGKVNAECAYARYSVGFGTSDSVYHYTQLGSDSSSVISTCFAHNGTKLTVTGFTYLTSGTVLYAKALAKGCNGGAGGQSSTALGVLRIG